MIRIGDRKTHPALGRYRLRPHVRAQMISTVGFYGDVFKRIFEPEIRAAAEIQPDGASAVPRRRGIKIYCCA